MFRSLFNSSGYSLDAAAAALAQPAVGRRRVIGACIAAVVLSLAAGTTRASGLSAAPSPSSAATALGAKPTPAMTPAVAGSPSVRPNPIASFTGPLLVVGDSLSAEYGLKRGSGWVDLMGARLAQRKPPIDVINASISGDTTAGGRSRLGALLTKHQPRAVVIELGGNDALRGLDLGQTEANLRAMVVAVQATGAKAIIVGMMMPPNYGKAYGDRFASIYSTVASSQHVALVPFLLQGLSDRLELFQADQIHPLESAQPALLDNVWPTVDAVLRGR